MTIIKMLSQCDALHNSAIVLCCHYSRYLISKGFAWFRRIGFSIAQRLARDGACVMVSSRKQQNVDKAVQQLREEDGNTVGGVVCHVGKAEHRKRLIEEVP